jgi:PAS domain S-box-containing protein
VSINKNHDDSSADKVDHAYFLKQMANVMNEVMWITDINKHKIIYISPGYEKIWGSTAQSLYDAPMSFINAIHPDDRDRVVAAFAKQVDGTYSETYRIIRPDGELRWIQDRSYPPTPSEDGTLCVVGIAQDITEQRLADMALVATEAKLRAIIEAIPVPVALNNEAQEITLLNPAFIRTFGYSKEEIPNLDAWWPKAYPDPQYRQWVAESWKAEIQTAKETQSRFNSIELNICCKDGSSKTVLASAAPLLSGYKGEHLVILYDISGLKKSEKDRENLKTKLIHSSKMASLGELAAGIAHEINNPLSIVEGAINLIHRFRDNPEKFATSVETTQKACLRIGKIVSGLKKFSRTTVAPTLKQISLSAIAKEALVLTSIKSNRSQATITCEFISDAKILADEVSIEQVVINLINNALDAVLECDDRWIKVEVTEDSQSVVLKISNSGPEIPVEIQKKIFEPFFTTKPVGEGTGLGLSICKGILDDHKATIDLLPDVPYTCFEVRFPKVL